MNYTQSHFLGNSGRGCSGTWVWLIWKTIKTEVISCY